MSPLDAAASAVAVRRWTATHGGDGRDAPDPTPDDYAIAEAVFDALDLWDWDGDFIDDDDPPAPRRAIVDVPTGRYL